MKTTNIIGWLFIGGALGVFIPYTILTITFDYPGILRQDVGLVLTKFHQGGNSLILTWWFFAILGFPLLIAYMQLGQVLEKKSTSVSWLTTIGVIGLTAQMIGLLRWTFVVIRRHSLDVLFKRLVKIDYLAMLATGEGVRQISKR